MSLIAYIEGLLLGTVVGALGFLPVSDTTVALVALGAYLAVTVYQVYGATRWGGRAEDD